MSIAMNNQSQPPRKRLRTGNMLLRGLNVAPDEEKKQPTPRRKNSFDGWLHIKKKLIHAIGPNLSAHLKWNGGPLIMGLTCIKCSSDTGLTGWFTEHKPAATFTFTTTKSHLLSNKHKARCTAEEKSQVCTSYSTLTHLGTHNRCPRHTD